MPGAGLAIRGAAAGGRELWPFLKLWGGRAFGAANAAIIPLMLWDMLKGSPEAGTQTPQGIDSSILGGEEYSPYALRQEKERRKAMAVLSDAEEIRQRSRDPGIPGSTEALLQALMGGQVGLPGALQRQIASYALTDDPERLERALAPPPPLSPVVAAMVRQPYLPGKSEFLR